jgi:acyl carrier protein
MAPTQADVEEVILDLLAKETDRDRDSLREELLAEGADMPFSSLVLVEFVVELEKRFGVRIPHTTVAANALRSVSTFARLIVTLASADAG